MTKSPSEIVKDEQLYATMGNSENSSNQYGDFKQIHVAISTELAKEREQFPAHFPKPIHVLLPVDARISDQWQERLQQAKKYYNPENIVLFPYYTKNSHWIGVILRFNINGQLERAEYIDPVVKSNFNPTKLQMEFSELFSGVVLKSMTLQTHSDPKYSAELTIRNLLNAIKETHSTNVTSQSINNMREKKLDDHNTITSARSINEERKLSASAIPQGNILEQPYEQHFLNSESANMKFQSRSDPTVKVSSIIQPIYPNETCNANDDANTHQRTFGQLAEVENVADHSQSRESDASVLEKEKQLRFKLCEAPSSQLEKSLSKNDISSEEEPLKQITPRKELIQSPENEERYIIAQKTKASLLELEQSQLLVEQVNALTSSHENVECEGITDHMSATDLMNNKLKDVESKTEFEIDKEQVEEYLITEEYLINMWNDSSQLPPCSEKYIISLLFYISLKLANKTMISRCKIKVPNEIEQEIMKEFDCLKEMLRIEELQSGEFHNIIERCSVYLRNESWKNAFTDLRKLLKEVRPLDIQELIRLIAKVNDAAKLIKDKEIILFLGGTGTGKSTTIHFLGGSKMAKTNVQGMNHIAPIEIKNLDLRKITTAPFARSETRYISPVTVNYKDIGGNSDGSIILCDSPGFEDTHGPEVDIANGIGIVRAIKTCKSVRPVVLISYKSIGDRCTGVKDLAHMLVGLIPGIKNDDYMQTFFYLFTKFPTNEKSTINALLKNVQDNLKEEEKSDSSFTSFLKDMTRKTRKKVRVIDPINDDPLEILEELAESEAITYPEEVFHFFITEKSKSILREQVRKHQISIRSATKRSDYLFIQYKLDQLKNLNDLLHQDDIEQRRSGVKATFRPKIFSRNNYMTVTRSIWATNITG